MKALKVIGALFGVALLAIAGLIGWLSVRKPAQRPPIDEKVAATPERLARGAYLANNVSNCLDCHSSRDITAYAMPVVKGTEGGGGFVFDANVGVPGVVVARNLTPDVETGKGKWTDGELIRAIREGIDKDGNALFPMMPYELFRHMSDEDVRSVVAYIRTLKPIRKEIPPRRIDFPVNLFIKDVPKPVEGPIATPDDAKDHQAYGKYMATIAGCVECHTKKEKGKVVGEPFAGGWVFTLPGQQKVVSANITPHPSTYLGQASKEEFIGRFKSWLTIDEKAPPPKGQNTVMPWRFYAGMTEKDLGAIYDYLKTVKPVDVKHDLWPGPAVAAK